MKFKPSFLILAALALLSAGCVQFRQPKEFRNRKMKEDPPVLNQAPGPQPVLALQPRPAARQGA